MAPQSTKLGPPGSLRDGLGEVTESGLQPIGVAVSDPKDGKLIYKLTPHRPLLNVPRI